MNTRNSQYNKSEKQNEKNKIIKKYAGNIIGRNSYNYNYNSN